MLNEGGLIGAVVAPWGEGRGSSCIRKVVGSSITNKYYKCREEFHMCI